MHALASSDINSDWTSGAALIPPFKTERRTAVMAIVKNFIVGEGIELEREVEWKVGLVRRVKLERTCGWVTSTEEIKTLCPEGFIPCSLTRVLSEKSYVHETVRVVQTSHMDVEPVLCECLRAVLGGTAHNY